MWGCALGLFEASALMATSPRKEERKKERKKERRPNSIVAFIRNN